MIWINYEHYKGGTYNLCIVMDNLGHIARSTKGKKQALRNFYAMLKREEKRANG